MALGLTAIAAQKVQSHLTQRGGLGVRLKVQTSSDCDGFVYLLEFVDESDPHDLVFESFGVRIYVDPKTLVYVDESEIRYIETDNNSGFVINNPNARERCGCGQSYHVNN